MRRRDGRQNALYFTLQSGSDREKGESAPTTSSHSFNTVKSIQTSVRFHAHKIDTRNPCSSLQDAQVQWGPVMIQNKYGYNCTTIGT